MKPPPVINRGASRTRRRNLLFVLASVLVLAFGAKVALFGFSQPRRPTESELLKGFHDHRAAFEQLKEMFHADSSMELRQVAKHGIWTYMPPFEGKPPSTKLSEERYHQYLQLLDQVDSPLIAKSPAGNPSIAVWQGGHYGHWNHIEIAWVDKEPTNQISNLDLCRNLGTNLFYRHIEGGWYFVTNMKPR